MATIEAAVGLGQPNREADVRTVRTLLRRHLVWLLPLRAPAADGPADDLLFSQIVRFQLRACAYLAPGQAGGGYVADGIVDPGGLTLRRLNLAVIPRPRSIVLTAPSLAPAQTKLTVGDYQRAARALGCEVAAVQAVATVEAGTRGPFNASGKPTILYERHYFRDLTGSRYDRSHPTLSGGYDPTRYGRYSEQYPKLQRAAVLDENAALQSASWGLFQIMGANHVACGFADVQGYVAAMARGVGEHLDAFVAFIRADPRLARAIVAKDWTTFARVYNGPRFADNAYDVKMRTEYERLKRGGSN